MNVELACPSCSSQYQCLPSNRVPTILLCGHTICGLCAEDCFVAQPPCCPICSIQIAEKEINFMLLDVLGCPVVETCVIKRPKHFSALLENLHDGFVELQTAADRISHDKQKLLACVETSIERFQNDVSDVITRLNVYASNTIAIARAACAERVKILNAQVDEFMVSAGQISACLKGTTNLLDRQDSDNVPSLSQHALTLHNLCDASTASRVPAALTIEIKMAPLLQKLDVMAKLWLYDIDSEKCSVTGSGLLYAILDSNAITVTCVDRDGLMAEWISEQDVLVRVTNAEGRPVGRQADTQGVGTGKVQVQYVVHDQSVQELFLHVSILNTNLSNTPWKVGVLGVGQIRDDARVSKRLGLNETSRHGLAVTQDGKHFIVANELDHGLSVYSMETGKCIRKFGRMGSEAGQFNSPYRMCSTPNGTILVAEYANKRIQEVTLFGEHVRFFGLGLLGDGSFFSICMQGDIVAVGKYDMNAEERIFLFNYSSGEFLRKFGSFGGSEGQTAYITGLSFSPDGRHLLVGEYASRLSLFSVEGTFITTIGGAGLCGSGFKDVLYTDSCIFVADADRHSIRVFSSKTGGILQIWDWQGDIDRRFTYPSALAIHKNKLLVLDSCRSRVQILE